MRPHYWTLICTRASIVGRPVGWRGWVISSDTALPKPIALALPPCSTATGEHDLLGMLPGLGDGSFTAVQPCPPGRVPRGEHYPRRGGDRVDVDWPCCGSAVPALQMRPDATLFQFPAGNFRSDLGPAEGDGRARRRMAGGWAPRLGVSREGSHLIDPREPSCLCEGALVGSCCLGEGRAPGPAEVRGWTCFRSGEPEGDGFRCIRIEAHVSADPEREPGQRIHR